MAWTPDLPFGVREVYDIRVGRRVPCNGFEVVQGDRPIVGQYLGNATPIACNVACPFCSETMLKATGITNGPHCVMKIVKEADTYTDVVGHLIPETHQPFFCVPCQVGFTLPKDGGFVDAG